MLCRGCTEEKPEVLLVAGLCNPCRVRKQREVELERAGNEASPIPDAMRKLTEQLAQVPASKTLAAQPRRSRKNKEVDPQRVIDMAAEASKELAKRELARRRYLPFVMRFNPDYQAGWLHMDIAARLEKFMEDVEERKSPRLMIFCPPRHGKSQLTSKGYPAWVLGHHPTWEFMLCSYSGALSMQFSRNVRQIMREDSYSSLFPNTKLDPDSQSVEQWSTLQGGGMVAAGVGGAITGKGAHVLLIDDPVKNREDADSQQIRQVAWDWYTSTAYTRLAPGGGILVIQTRWHDDDLSGRLLEAMREGGDTWEVVSYPAIALKDEEFRYKDEPLHEARYPLDALHRIRRAIGERDWWALYQQSPVADSGAYFTSDMFTVYKHKDMPPREELVFYTAWDLAIGQKEENDNTVGITVGIDRQQDLWVVDCRVGKWDALGIVDEMINVYEAWGSTITGIEKGQIEMSIGPMLQRRIQEKKAWSFYTEGLKHGKRDKPARARPIQGMMRAGKVHFPHSEEKPWVIALKNEMLRFPKGVHDDRVDAMAWLGQMLVEMAPSIPQTPKKEKSWKDRLAEFTKDGTRDWRSA